MEQKDFDDFKKRFKERVFNNNSITKYFVEVPEAGKLGEFFVGFYLNRQEVQSASNEFKEYLKNYISFMLGSNWHDYYGIESTFEYKCKHSKLIRMAKKEGLKFFKAYECDEYVQKLESISKKAEKTEHDM